VEMAAEEVAAAAEEGGERRLLLLGITVCTSGKVRQPAGRCRAPWLSAFYLLPAHSDACLHVY
jgi:hypothetical protein